MGDDNEKEMETIITITKRPVQKPEQKLTDKIEKFSFDDLDLKK